MRHRFLLDENIIYHAIRGVDRHDNPDRTATRLILAIVKICHSLVVHNDILVRYVRILERLKHDRAPHLDPGYFFNLLFKRADKRTIDYDALPELPPDCMVPRKDEYLVRAALVSHPLLVTADEALYDAVKKNPELAIEVLWPDEALTRASERP